MTYKTFEKNDGGTDDSGDDDYVLSSMFKNADRKGYSVWSAAMFITALMAGMGVLALPRAMAGTGWWGVLLLAVASVNSCYCALLLGRIWLMLEERWVEYRCKFRFPYPAMGLRAVGPWMRWTVTAALHVTLLGAATVFLLLAAQIGQSLVRGLFRLDHTTWIVAIATALCPFTWFGSLEDFWFAGVGALATAVLACYGLLASVLLLLRDGQAAAPVYAKPSFTSFSLAFGTILFSFGGVYAFPNIQNDMAVRQRFPRATFLGFAGLLLLYLPVTVSAYAVLGAGVPANVLLAVPPGFLRTFVEACLVVHILLAFLLLLNPVCQEVEEALRVRPGFGWQRCVVRSLLVGVVLLVAWAVPHFDRILNLIGGSTMTLLTFIFPPVFYVALQAGQKDDAASKTMMSRWEKAFLCQVVGVGVAGGVACTYFALVDIVNVSINSPEPVVMPVF